MTAGSFMGKTFTASDIQVFTPNNLSGTAGAEYSSHDRPQRKPQKQYLGPKARTYSVDLLLRAQDGVRPRDLRDYFIRCSEEGKADYFIVGSKPICDCRLIITSINDDWDEVILNGVLSVCKLTLSLEEYA